MTDVFDGGDALVFHFKDIAASVNRKPVLHQDREKRSVVTIIDKPTHVPYIPKVPFPEMEEEPIVSWNGTLMPFSEFQAARAKHHAEMRRIAMAGGWAR